MRLARIFIDADTDRYARKQRWTDDLLVKVVEEVEKGLNDGALGLGVFKRRIARAGAGSSAGYRIVVVLRLGDKAFVIEAYAKNVKKLHSPDEVRALRALADHLLAMSDDAIGLVLKTGDLRELVRGHETDENP